MHVGDGAHLALWMKAPFQFAAALLFLSGVSLPLAGQEEGGVRKFIRRYVERVMGEGADPSAPKFINYPTLAYTPETSWEFGVSSLYVYSANRDLNNRLSEVKA